MKFLKKKKKKPKPINLGHSLTFHMFEIPNKWFSFLED